MSDGRDSSHELARPKTRSKTDEQSPSSEGSEVAVQIADDWRTVMQFNFSQLEHLLAQQKNISPQLCLLPSQQTGSFHNSVFYSISSPSPSSLFSAFFSTPQLRFAPTYSMQFGCSGETWVKPSLKGLISQQRTVQNAGKANPAGIDLVQRNGFEGSMKVAARWKNLLEHPKHVSDACGTQINHHQMLRLPSLNYGKSIAVDDRSSEQNPMISAAKDSMYEINVVKESSKVLLQARGARGKEIPYSSAKKKKPVEEEQKAEESVVVATTRSNRKVKVAPWIAEGMKQLIPKDMTKSTSRKSPTSVLSNEEHASGSFHVSTISNTSKKPSGKRSTSSTPRKRPSSQTLQSAGAGRGDLFGTLSDRLAGEAIPSCSELMLGEGGGLLQEEPGNSLFLENGNVEWSALEDLLGNNTQFPELDLSDSCGGGHVVSHRITTWPTAAASSRQRKRLKGKIKEEGMQQEQRAAIQWPKMKGERSRRRNGPEGGDGCCTGWGSDLVLCGADLEGEYQSGKMDHVLVDALPDWMILEGGDFHEEKVGDLLSSLEDFGDLDCLEENGSDRLGASCLRGKGEMETKSITDEDAIPSMVECPKAEFPERTVAEETCGMNKVSVSQREDSVSGRFEGSQALPLEVFRSQEGPEGVLLGEREGQEKKWVVDSGCSLVEGTEITLMKPEEQAKVVMGTLERVTMMSKSVGVSSCQWLDERDRSARTDGVESVQRLWELKKWDDTLSIPPADGCGSEKEGPVLEEGADNPWTAQALMPARNAAIPLADDLDGLRVGDQPLADGVGNGNEACPLPHCTSSPDAKSGEGEVVEKMQCLPGDEDQGDKQQPHKPVREEGRTPDSEAHIQHEDATGPSKLHAELQPSEEAVNAAPSSAIIRTYAKGFSTEATENPDLRGRPIRSDSTTSGMVVYTRRMRQKISTCQFYTRKRKSPGGVSVSATTGCSQMETSTSDASLPSGREQKNLKERRLTRAATASLRKAQTMP